MEGSIAPFSPFAAGKKIIVVGGGIAGLSFVLALRKQWLSQSPSLTPPTITIYERDLKDVGVEREGYSISIQSDGNSAGMKALSNLGLLETMLAQSITGVQENPGTFGLWDKNWNSILRIRRKHTGTLPASGMRIARNVLRRILIESVPAGDKIHWGTACTGAVRLSNGKVGVQLINGKLDECDFLVAADGSRSKVRSSFRPDDKLNFSGAFMIGGNARFKDKVPPPVDRDWGMYLSGTGNGLFVSPIDDHSAVWSLSYLTPQPRKLIKQPLSREQADLLLNEALERGKDFAEPFQTLVKATDISTLMMLNALDKQPFPHGVGSLQDIPIVFIGDANHALSPYSGSGANLALLDGWEIAEQLCKCDSLTSALAAFDALNIPRAKSILRFSHWSISLAHWTGWRLIMWTWVAKLLNWVFFS